MSKVLKEQKRKEETDKTEHLKSYPKLLAELLRLRGIQDTDEAERFLNPDYDAHTHDPSLLADADKAAKRIINAIDKDEKVVIYSDFDADGIPGGVVLADFFKRVGFKNYSNYIPHRHDEGYGLSMKAVEGFGEKGTALLITIDCGISNAEEVKKANELGMDVIITDHHEPPADLPPAYAVVNPKRTDCKYPFKGLCGAAVIYKVIQATLKQRDFGLKKGTEKWFLDMVGLATLSDMVPLVDENRVFAYYGLLVLRKTPRPGIVRLCRKLGVFQKKMTEDDIGFMITPRINAASRMGVSEDAFRLLASDDEREADVLAGELNKMNDKRKGAVASIVKDIRKHIEDRETDNPLRSVIVLGNPEWRPSLLGLAANALASDYNRPVFLWGREGSNIIKGSARTGGNGSVVHIMRETKDVFIDYGGHHASGGFSVPYEAVHTLEDKLSEAYDGLKEKETEEETVSADADLSLDDVTDATYRMIDRLAPFGMSNPKPLFMFKNIEICEVQHFGKEKNHLRINFKNTRGGIVSAIGFFMTDRDFDRSIEVGDSINLLAPIEQSYFRGRPELRLRIVKLT